MANKHAGNIHTHDCQLTACLTPSVSSTSSANKPVGHVHTHCCQHTKCLAPSVSSTSTANQHVGNSCNLRNVSPRGSLRRLRRTNISNKHLENVHTNSCQHTKCKSSSVSSMSTPYKHVGNVHTHGVQHKKCPTLSVSATSMANKYVKTSVGTAANIRDVCPRASLRRLRRTNRWKYPYKRQCCFQQSLIRCFMLITFSLISSLFGSLYIF